MWTRVREKYKNERLRKLDIEHHLIECFSKLRRYMAHDKCPFNEPSFLKEIADLYILLEFHKDYDENFRELVENRKDRFIEKNK